MIEPKRESLSGSVSSTLYQKQKIIRSTEDSSSPSILTGSPSRCMGSTPMGAVFVKSPHTSAASLQSKPAGDVRAPSDHVSPATLPPSQTVSASSSLPVPASGSSSVLPGHSSSTQLAEPHVSDTKAPVTPKEVLPEPKPHLESQARAAYIRSRLHRAKKKKHDLHQKLADVKQEEEQARMTIERLRILQEQAELAQQKQQSALETARKASEEARAEYKAQQDGLNRTRSVVDSFFKSIGREENSVSRCKSNEEDIAKQIEDLEAARVQATRQAEVLDLKPFEVATLSKYASSNMTFHNKLVRMTQGTATEVMCRDIKSEVLDALTSVTKDELADLAHKVLSAAEGSDRDTAAGKGLETPSSRSKNDASSGSRKRKAQSPTLSDIESLLQTSDDESSDQSSDDESSEQSSESESDSPIRPRTRRGRPARNNVDTYPA